MSDLIAAEILKVIPTILWILFIVVILFTYREYIPRALDRMNNFKAFGVEFSFFDERLELAAKRKSSEISESSNEDLEIATATRHITISENDRSRLFRRLNRVSPILEGAHILWVDDSPENNIPETTILRSLGIYVHQAESTGKAWEMLRNNTKYDLIISDMSRNGVQDEGLNFLQKMRDTKKHLQLIFYVGQLDESKGLPISAFGITNRPDELLHYVLDVLERERS